jgi:peptidyl-prolyl cis-trans isomerase C
MNKTLISLVIASTFTLTACKEGLSTSGNSSLTPVTVSKEDAVASVNGQYISKSSLEALEKEISQRSRGQSFPQEKLLEELIQRELLVQDATIKKLDQTPEFNKQLATIKQSLLSQASVQNYLKNNELTDADLRAEYDKKMGSSAGDEYKARHILVKTEEDAKQIIKDLEGGADFVELAKKKSTGPSGPKGGDLGWFAANQMVPPFSEAVKVLEDNKFTTEPVKTQFGYHIILREGSRAQTPPSFDSVKEKIRPALQREKVQSFLTSLREQAKVEVLLGKEEASVTPAAIPAVQNKALDVTSGVADAVKNTAGQATDAVAQTVEKATDITTDTAKKAVDTVKEAVTTK